MGNLKAQEARCLTERVRFSVIIPSASLVANYLRRAKKVNCFSIHLKEQSSLEQTQRERVKDK